MLDSSNALGTFFLNRTGSPGVGCVEGNLYKNYPNPSGNNDSARGLQLMRVVAQHSRFCCPHKGTARNPWQDTLGYLNLEGAIWIDQCSQHSWNQDERFDFDLCKSDQVPHIRRKTRGPFHVLWVESCVYMVNTAEYSFYNNNFYDNIRLS